MATATKTNTTDPKDILSRVEEEGIEFIRFWFTDIEGQLKSFAVGKEELEGALEEGMGFDGSSITGFNAIEESDMIAMPDPDTYAVLPWRDDGGDGKIFVLPVEEAVRIRTGEEGEAVLQAHAEEEIPA